MKKVWFDEAWADYLYWQHQDKKMLKRINDLLRDIERSNFDGIGKPEPLKGELSGFWSRRIDTANRFVYRIENGVLEILSCKGHYDADIVTTERIMSLSAIEQLSKSYVAAYYMPQKNDSGVHIIYPRIGMM